MTSPTWLLWQLADSAFPTGGFAHSGGLEAAAHYGELSDPDALRQYLKTSLEQCGRASLPFMTSAYRAASQWIEVDLLCDCFISNHVANRASRLQGQALMASAERIFGRAGLSRFPGASERKAACYHSAPVFGVVTAALGVELEPAARLLLFGHLRGLVAAAVRLGLVGPLQGQALQYQMSATAEQTLEQCLNLGLEDVAQTAPLLDLWQAGQDRLYSRLFQS